ncbi:gliding motility-associated C-terminal domain-containing protein [Flavobacterium sp. NRK F10]|uniref:gliding motility-associated C-terminal domain-containing protein n=1 Tax=Flavobacterium sp. NRK F10 TaxID=2954931 RepID=UPI0020912E89|nr:gliding motility-associated C-terminal domain-containing protein [Flavobacterium sp. NRK F10]MCO6173754.1 gliding motility-associated C-terminal domain-containing protein [Flavobacterium sp. NRK F10]
MTKKTRNLFFFILSLLSYYSYSQDVSLYTQVNGRYDFTFVGNTMNTAENNTSAGSVTITSSSATLNLGPNDTVVKAYLYWAGSGDGDFDVQLNGNAITPDRTFSHSRFFSPNTYTYFSAFKDITSYVQSYGNGTYELSGLDISAYESLHLIRKTNFAGWAILIVYENPVFQLNQINIYDGLQGVPDNLSINLTNLNVLDNNGATAGFIAWEGDAVLPTESFYINSQVLSNALNPANNVFNGTNSVTGSNTLYNMDLDIYNIQNYIQVSDTDALIELTSFQDFIMINAVAVKLNSQLPDATIVLNDYSTSCNSDSITVDYTVYNVNSTEILPEDTTIGFYVNNTLIGTTFTQNPIAIGANEQGSVTLTIPLDATEIFILTATVDYDNTILELVETNNSFEIEITQWLSPPFATLENLTSCNLGLTKGNFDFSAYEESVTTNADHSVTFYNSYEDAENEQNEILNTMNYEALTTPETIYVRIENEFGCYSITSFDLIVRNCPPTIYNAVSANNDGYNDDFFIDGLRDIFTDFKLEIYNRWGKLLWTGNNNVPNWDGYVKDGFAGNKAPEGTYFYILYLNDEDYPEALTGYLYLTY